MQSALSDWPPPAFLPGWDWLVLLTSTTGNIGMNCLILGVAWNARTTQILFPLKAVSRHLDRHTSHLYTQTTLNLFTLKAAKLESSVLFHSASKDLHPSPRLHPRLPVAALLHFVQPNPFLPFKKKKKVLTNNHPYFSPPILSWQSSFLIKKKNRI